MAPKRPARVTEIANMEEGQVGRERELGSAPVVLGLPVTHAHEV